MEQIKDAIIATLAAAVERKSKVFVDLKSVGKDSASILNLYDDSSGQRGVIVKEGPYGSKRSFLLARKLSFTNPGDEGKDGAILGTLQPDNAKNVSIQSEEGRVTAVILDNLNIYFHRT